METRLYDTPGVYGALAHSCRSSKMVIGCGDKRLKVMVFMGIHHQKKTERENGCIISLGDIMTVSFCQLLSASVSFNPHRHSLVLTHKLSTHVDIHDFQPPPDLSVDTSSYQLKLPLLTIDDHYLYGGVHKFYGYPHSWMVIVENPIKMDDDWGYPYHLVNHHNS